MRAATKTIIEAALTGDEAVSKRKRQAILDLLDRPDEELSSANAPATANDEYLTQAAAARFLSVSRSTVFRMERDKQFEPVIMRPGKGKIRPGGLKRYRKSDLIKLFSNAKEKERRK